MRRVLCIARAELLEHRRQPWMIFILVVNYALFLAVFGAFFLVLDGLAREPQQLAALERQMSGIGVKLQAALQLAVSTFGSLQLTNLPLYVAILSGTSVLHDRECGTMPFLMLAPLTRRQLLLGKLLGALALPLLLHGVLVGAGCLLLSRLEVLAPFAAKLGASPEWWVAFLVGAPASAAFVGALGTVISALSRDVRTSMQYTSFFIGILSLGIGAVLVDGIGQGLALQLLFAGACLVAAALTLLVGARLISRDLREP